MEQEGRESSTFLKYRNPELLNQPRFGRCAVVERVDGEKRWKTYCRTLRGVVSLNMQGSAGV